MMDTNLHDKMKELSPAQRKKVEARNPISRTQRLSIHRKRGSPAKAVIGAGRRSHDQTNHNFRGRP